MERNKMFTPKKKSRVDIEINKLALALNDHAPDSNEYGKILDRLSKLQEVRQSSKPDRLSWNTGAIIAAHVVGIIMITRYENEHVITSKALGFIPKLR